MIIVCATFNIDPADLQSFASWVEPFIAAFENEEGCLTYQFSLSAYQGSTAYMVSIFDSEENFLTHRTAESHQRFMSELSKQPVTVIARYFEATPAMRLSSSDYAGKS